MHKKLEVDMTGGRLFPKIVKFAIPLILMNILQILFNVSDVMVLGLFAGDDPVAAVGSTSSLINLIVGLFVGLSVGANVMVSEYLGSGDADRVKRTIGMSIVISLTVGAGLLFVGVFGARTFLILMNCDPQVLDMAEKYLIIYFIGMPVNMLYNFCASILRAAGETVKPLIYLTIGGVLNIMLNIIFILVFKKDVEGVAIATVVSQTFSAVACLITIIRGSGTVKLRRKYLRIYKSELLEIIKVGVPSGIQGCLFAFSNVIIQSTINLFGKDMMAGNAYGLQIESFTYFAMNGVGLTALSFVSQNYGAKNFERVKKTVIECLLFVMGVGVVMGGIMALIPEVLVGLISKDAVVVGYACTRMRIICGLYFLCGTMDVLSYSLRGLGKSTTAMVVTLFGSCVLRIVWIKVIMIFINDIKVVYWAYPLTWAITTVFLAILCFVSINKLQKKYSKDINIQK